MLNCESCQILLADSIYSAAESHQQRLLDAHLKNCDECRHLLQELISNKKLLEDAGATCSDSPEMSRGTELPKLWQNIQSDLDRIDAERYRQLNAKRNSRTVAGLLAAAASLVLFVSLWPTPGIELNPAPQPVATNLVSPDLMNYLTRAEVMLLSVANAESSNGSVVPLRQTFARTMAQEASVLNASLEHRINSGQEMLLKEIEFILLQIANLDESNMERGVRLLQEYLEDNSVLFKIRLLEMRNQDPLI